MPLGSIFEFKPFLSVDFHILMGRCAILGVHSGVLPGDIICLPITLSYFIHFNLLSSKLFTNYQIIQIVH